MVINKHNRIEIENISYRNWRTYNGLSGVVKKLRVIIGDKTIWFLNPAVVTLVVIKKSYESCTAIIVPLQNLEGLGSSLGRWMIRSLVKKVRQEFRYLKVI